MALAVALAALEVPRRTGDRCQQGEQEEAGLLQHDGHEDAAEQRRGRREEREPGRFGLGRHLVDGREDDLLGACRPQRRPVERDLSQLVDAHLGLGVDRPAGEHRVAEPQLGGRTDDDGAVGPFAVDQQRVGGVGVLPERDREVVGHGHLHVGAGDGGVGDGPVVAVALGPAPRAAEGVGAGAQLGPPPRGRAADGLDPDDGLRRRGAEPGGGVGDGEDLTGHQADLGQRGGRVEHLTGGAARQGRRRGRPRGRWRGPPAARRRCGWARRWPRRRW